VKLDAPPNQIWTRSVLKQLSDSITISAINKGLVYLKGREPLFAIALLFTSHFQSLLFLFLLIGADAFFALSSLLLQLGHFGQTLGFQGTFPFLNGRFFGQFLFFLASQPLFLQ
jgi:hypothetical protein